MKKLLLIFAALLGLNMTANSQENLDVVDKHVDGNCQ